jgi:hypothetical protein
MAGNPCISCPVRQSRLQRWFYWTLQQLLIPRPTLYGTYSTAQLTKVSQIFPLIVSLRTGRHRLVRILGLRQSILLDCDDLALKTRQM